MSEWFFKLLPCDLFVFKAVSFVAMFISAIIIGKTGELFDKKHGWMAGILVFISISFTHSFLQVEDDLLGYPVLFLANYFFLKSGFNKSNYLKALAVALVLITGALLWKGALLYLVVYSFFFVLGIIVLYSVLYYIGFGAMHALLGNNLIQENVNGFLSLLQPGTLGFGHGIGLLGMYILNRRIWLVIPFFVAMLLNIKWAVHLSPFLGLGLMFLVVDINNFRIRKGIVFREAWANKHFINIFIVLALVSTSTLSIGILLQPPYDSQLEAVEFAVQQAEGKKIDNDWSYGYYIMYFGGDTNTFGGGWPRYTESWNDKILLTENPEPNPDCKLLRVWEKGGFYQEDIKVYNCEGAKSK